METSKIIKIKYSTVILMNTQDQFWISQRLDINKGAYLSWQCPGGKMELEDDNNPLLCAKRETEEETGINILQDITGKTIFVNKYHYYGIYEGKESKITFYVYIHKTILTPQRKETTNSEWKAVTIKQLMELSIIQSMREQIIIEGIIGSGKTTLVKIIEEKLTHFGGNRNQVKVKIMPEVVLSDRCKTTLQQYYEIIEKVEENQEPLEEENLKAELEYYAIKIQTMIKELYMIEYSNIIKEVFMGIKYDYIIHDRTLLSTKIFMKLMIEKGYISELDYEFITRDYGNYERFLNQNSIAIYHNTNIEISNQRIISRGRNFEKAKQIQGYNRDLQDEYDKMIPTLYQEFNIIGYCKNNVPLNRDTGIPISTHKNKIWYKIKDHFNKKYNFRL